MKKILLLLMLMLGFINAFAQDDDLDSYSFETEPLKSESTPYFAIGAGYNYSFLMMNYDEVNKYVVDKLGLKKFDGAIALSGVHGFTGLVVIPNTRLGFFGMSGSKLSEADVKSSSGTKEGTRSSELTVSMNGFSLDYGYVPFKGFAILPGFNFGWGQYKLESVESPLVMDWSDFDKIDLSGTKMNRLENSFMFVQPQLNLEYAVTNFAMLRANVAYNLSFANPLSDKDWLLNKNTEVKNVPSKMNSNGVSFQIGIYLGLFNY